MRFEWDPRKAAANAAKHGVSFEEAQEVFAGSPVTILDAAHSALEPRFWTVGPIARGIILVVWTAREAGVIRIISARPASRAERRLYRQHRGQQ